MILIENSLRLDAVVSGGLSISRTSLLRLMDDKKVIVNDQVAMSSSTLVKVGSNLYCSLSFLINHSLRRDRQSSYNQSEK